MPRGKTEQAEQIIPKLREVEVVSALPSPQSLYGGFSAVNVVLRNLDIRTTDNPRIGGVDLGPAMQCKLENVFINTGTYNVRASEPVHGTIGLVTPAINNAARTVLRNVTVTGYDTGILVNEHTDGDNIVIGSNLHGLRFAKAHHASRFARVSCCATCITSRSAVRTASRSTSSTSSKPAPIRPTHGMRGR